MKILWKTHRNQIIILFHHILLGFFLYKYNINFLEYLGLAIYATLSARIISSKIVHFHFSHRTYTDNFINYLYTLLVLVTAVGSPISFSASHRQHHLYVDSDKDPHSPAIIGPARVYFLFWKSQIINPKLIKDFARSKFQLFVHRNWAAMHFILLAGIFIINPIAVMAGVSVVVVFTFHFASMVNVLGHLHGEARNCPEIKFIQWWAWRHKDHHININN